MSPMEPYLATLIDEEWSYLERVIKAGQRVVTRIRHHWTEDVLEEHAEWLSLSKALLAANERTFAQGRPGLKVQSVAPPPLATSSIVDGAFVDRVLRANIPAYGGEVKRLQMDGKYRLTDQKGVAAILAWDLTDKIAYESEYFDCDKFARIIWARFVEHWRLNQVGFVVDYSSAHAYNLAVFPDGSMWSIEPQNDGVIKLGESIYKLQRGFIVL